MTIGFIGAGKVGFTLGKYFSEHGLQVAGYYSRGTDSAVKASEFTDTKPYEEMGEIVKDCDVLFLTVPDGVISEVFEDLRKYPIEGKVICHASGAMTSKDGFPGIEDTGAFGYSVHPLFAVSDKYHAYEELEDVFFAVEGTDPIDKIGAILTEAGLKWQLIDPDGKTKYHLAAAIASNLVVGLLGFSQELFNEVGFTKLDALKAMTPLTSGNVSHVLKDGPAKALTGPLERGDAGTLKKHLSVLDSEDDRELYILLSKKLLAIAKEKHPDRDYSSVEDIIS
jgi:predicted short-subunit dehydrogenase-like oxidoreductase (DUF2520 family)